MARFCTEVTEWITEEISKPIEDWVETTEKKCKKRSRWNPLRWLCWLGTTLVKVVRWIVVTVVTAVITVVCHFVNDIFAISWNILKFLFNAFLALVTWDKCRWKDAVSNLADTGIGIGFLIGDVLTRPIIDRVQTYRLRNFVGEQIDEKFGADSDVANAIKSKLGVSTGVFGYRLKVSTYRMFLDSETRTPASGDVPNLIYLHQAQLINLYEVAGFDRSCAVFSEGSWGQPMPTTALKTYVSGGGIDLFDSEPPGITREQLKEYIESRGSRGPAFYIFSMSDGMQKKSFRTAEELGRQLGLILTFDSKGKEVTDHRYINDYQTRVTGVINDDADCATSKKGQIPFLICEMGRHPQRTTGCCDSNNKFNEFNGNLEAARTDLCLPMVIGAFVVKEGKKRISGLAHCFVEIGGDVNDPSRGALCTGVSFTAKRPVEARRFVLIHELGHFFSLKHVSGLDRVMATDEDNEGDEEDYNLLSWTNFWRVIPNTFLHAGPRFVYAESERAWRMILANYPATCLGAPTIEIE
jgi:hypothetical protein